MVQLYIYELVKVLKFKPRELSAKVLLEMVDSMIKAEFSHYYQLKYSIKEVKLVYDFKVDTTEIVHTVMKSFSKEFYTQLYQYYTKEYIISYVTKTIELILIEFIKEKKIKTK
jgi:hypothetical protein